MTILWKRLDHPGHEWCRLHREKGLWTLGGVAVFAFNDLACMLRYEIRCDASWATRSATISGTAGRKEVFVRITADRHGHWRLNGKTRAAVQGCIDVDLGFSPSTNLLPIRRLGLAVGKEARVRAAWVEFPSLKLKPLDQVYRRTGERAMRYESAGGAFVRDLTVDSDGFVTDCPGLWKAETPGG